MTTTYPTTKQTIPNPSSTDTLENVTPELDHDYQHSTVNDTIEALQDKVGVNGSAVTTSFDYKLSGVTGTDKAVSKTGTETLTNKTLTAPVINIGSDATGDMYYRNAGVLTRIPIGTSSQILISNGSTPSFQDNPAGSDASVTVKGVSEEATSAELTSGSGIGTTGARLFINPSTLMPNGLVNYSFLKGLCFGDSSDGDVTISTNSTISRDMYYDNLTVNTGVVLNPSGYRIFVSGTLTISGTGKIARDGNNGGNGSSGVGGTGGAALSAGTINGSLAGGAGGAGASAGTDAVDITNSIGSLTDAGDGGTSNAGGIAGGQGASSTVANPIIITPKFPIQLNAIDVFNTTGLFTSSGSGGGGASSVNNGGTRGGGGGGSAGGIVAVFARVVVLAATDSISAKGGNGGNGASSGLGDGAGGGGGNGGVIILVYSSISGTSLVASSACAGGTKGLKGGTNGSPTDGTDGATGIIYTYQI